MFERPDRIAAPLYVVTPVINASRYRSRWKHYCDFERMVQASGAILYTVEVAFGDRDFVVTKADDPRHLQLRTSHELWLKERAINLGVGRLPTTWQYVAWIDADCLFLRSDWANETLHQLQHSPIVQLWSQMVDLDKDFQITSKILVSFASIHLDSVSLPGDYATSQTYGCPGLAWATCRQVWDQLGGLLDCAILGAGDWYFANCIVGQVPGMIKIRKDFTPAFARWVSDYEQRVRRASWRGRAVLGNIGMVKGAVAHFWHGRRHNRGYGTRAKILTTHQFDPSRDLCPDWQGLYQLTDRCPQMRREIQAYFAARKEDE